MTNFGEDIEKMRNVYTFGESVIQAATMKILKKKKKKKKKELPLLAIYLKDLKTLIQKDICTSISIVTLFIFTVTWMQLDIITLIEVSKKEEDKHHMIPLMWNLKYDTNEPIYKMKSRLTESSPVVAKAKGDYGLHRQKNKVLLYRTGNYIQNPIGKHSRKYFFKECVYMYN